MCINWNTYDSYKISLVLSGHKAIVGYVELAELQINIASKNVRDSDVNGLEQKPVRLMFTHILPTPFSSKCPRMTLPKEVGYVKVSVLFCRIGHFCVGNFSLYAKF